MSDITRGTAKSGRWWKVEQTARFSSMKKDKPLRTTWKKKQAAKAEKLSVKQYQERLIEARKQEKLEYRRRVEAHRKTKDENQRKSEIVEIITNTAKLKRMKKKQLRRIEKRDTNELKSKRK